MGRPTICTRELAEEIADLLRRYGFVETVLNYVGVSKPAYYEWLAKGEADIERGEESTPYAVFTNAIKRAKSEFQLDNLDAIRDGKQGWQARSWLNERSDPDQFAIRNKIEHSGRVDTGTAPILTPAERDARLREILGEQPH